MAWSYMAQEGISSKMLPWHFSYAGGVLYGRIYDQFYSPNGFHFQFPDVISILPNRSNSMLTDPKSKRPAWPRWDRDRRPHRPSSPTC